MPGDESTQAETDRPDRLAFWAATPRRAHRMIEIVDLWSSTVFFSDDRPASGEAQGKHASRYTATA